MSTTPVQPPSTPDPPSVSTPSTSPLTAPPHERSRTGSTSPATTPAGAAMSGSPTAPGPAGPGGAGNGVWSASRAAVPDPIAEPKGARAGTVVWGVALAAMGALLIALGMGLHLDLTKVWIALLGGLGVLLLVLAVLPQRKGKGS